MAMGSVVSLFLFLMLPEHEGDDLVKEDEADASRLPAGTPLD
ncbi:MAG: hypothetical protein R3E18_11580 [Sphingomonadaceae bacterium]